MNARKRGWVLPIVFWLAAAVFTVATFYLARHMLFRSTDEVHKEALKALLQLSAVTGLGGALAGLLNWRRDREAKSDARVAALQDIDRDLGSSYRQLKAVKRQLRAQLLSANREDAKNPGRPSAPYVFRSEDFRASMADLLKAQIAAEDARDRIAARSDLFDDKQLQRLLGCLHYACRFYQDVLEDLEYGKVAFDGETCTVTVASGNIDNLLNGDIKRLLEREVVPPLSAEVKAALASYREHRKTAGPDRQHELLRAIEAARKDHDEARRRFRMVADNCFGMAATEIRQLIGAETNPGAKTRKPAEIAPSAPAAKIAA